MLLLYIMGMWSPRGEACSSQSVVLTIDAVRDSVNNDMSCGVHAR